MMCNINIRLKKTLGGVFLLGLIAISYFSQETSHYFILTGINISHRNIGSAR